MVGALLAVSLVACGGSNKKDTSTPKGVTGPGTVPTVDPTLCDTKGKRVETSDLNRDNRPDVWRLWETITEAGVRREILSCRQVDFDHDGRKDLVVAFNKKGATVWDKLDLTFDGKFDVWAQYDEKTGVLYQIQRDTDFDGAFDSIERYAENGDVEWIRRDRNGDQKPDVWEQFVAGKLVAILYDDDFDEKVDRREEMKKKKTTKPAPDGDKAPAGDGDKAPAGDGDKAPAGDGDKAPAGEGDKKDPAPAAKDSP